MARFVGMLYGAMCYAAFQISFLYFIGFLANIGVPKSIDTGDVMSLPGALGIDLGLLALFGVQHSVMARRGFKAWITRVMPASMERSTYVLATSVVLGVLFHLWQPLPQVVWRVESQGLRAVCWGMFAAGNLIILASTFMIDHFDLFGLRQVYLNWRARPYVPRPFCIAYLYRFVRHPLYLGFLIVFWSTPDMSLGHLVFALGMSTYIFIGVRYEERDLLETFGADYANYRRRVPMVLPQTGHSVAPLVVGADPSPLSRR